MNAIFNEKFEDRSLWPNNHELTPVESEYYFWANLLNLNQSMNIIAARLRWVLEQLEIYKITDPIRDLATDILLLMDHFYSKKCDYMRRKTRSRNQLIFACYWIRVTHLSDNDNNRGMSIGEGQKRLILTSLKWLAFYLKCGKVLDEVKRIQEEEDLDDVELTPPVFYV